MVASAYLDDHIKKQLTATPQACVCSIVMNLEIWQSRGSWKREEGRVKSDNTSIVLEVTVISRPWTF